MYVGQPGHAWFKYRPSVNARRSVPGGGGAVSGGGTQPLPSVQGGTVAYWAANP